MAREEAVGGRVRITDARAKGEVKWQKNVKLKTLAMPRYSYWPFMQKRILLNILQTMKVQKSR